MAPAMAKRSSQPVRSSLGHALTVAEVMHVRDTLLHEAEARAQHAPKCLDAPHVSAAARG